jgi:PilZ domain
LEASVSKPLHASEFEPAQAHVERQERRSVRMHGHILLEDGTTAEAVLIDLSYEGCSIETPIELSVDQPVTLSVLRRGAIEALVRWVSEGKAGLYFKALVAEKQQQPRATERISLDAEVMLRRLGQLNYRVRLFDLSPEGCRVELVERPREGEHLMIRFEGLELLDAEVCWVNEFVAGLRFEKPFHPAVFDLMVARLS